MYSICVVVPSWHYWIDPYKLQPLWEMYYATILRNHYAKDNVKVEIMDLRGNDKGSLEDAVRSIPEYDVYVYWIRKSGDAIEVQSIADLLKKRFPKSVHAAGGTHVNMRTEECVDHYDALVIGPGENSFINIVDDARAGKLKKVYSQDYREVHLKDTVFPDRDFLPESAIVNTKLFKQYGGVRGTSVFFSRGCLYRCTYCVYNVPTHLQLRTKEQMRAEVDYLIKNYDVSAINLRDEIAIHHKPEISSEMFEVFGEANVKWRGQTTTVATYDQLKMARETGCQELAIGVETVDENVMKIIKKTWQNQKQISEFVENAKSLGIKIKLCLILGLPGEPADVVEKTIKFIEQAQPDFVSLSGFCPMPGSPIFNNPKDYGLKYIDTDWSKHAHLLYRFSNEEEVGLPFEYEKEGPWGKTFSREEIKRNIQETQRWLESQNMVY
ncbi:B12-binding domain-containing radical SAM protein [Candidatus Latescibacterota bacterium]